MKRISKRLTQAVSVRPESLISFGENLAGRMRKYAPLTIGVALTCQSSIALAYSDDGILTPFQNLLSWICGPFALVVSGFALVGALISYMVQGNQHLPRFVAAVVGGIGLFLVQKIVTFMAGQAQ